VTRWLLGLALDLQESLRMAFGALRVSRARGVLTTLGIIIGIVAVITTMTAANGLQNNFRESFSSVGADVLFVTRMPWVIMDDFFLFRNRPPIELREAEALERKLRGRAVVSPSIDGRRDIRYRSERIDGVTVIGTTERQLMVSSAVPELGRFLMPFEVTYKRHVCVIGSTIRDGLFGTADPINQEIRIGPAAFRVVGVMEERGGSFFGGPDFDRQIFVPITTYVKAFGGHHGRQDVNVAVKAPSRAAMAELEYEIIGEMRKVRKLRPTEPDNFTINQLDTLVNAFNNTMGTVLLVGLLVTGISLFVGGVGVMNVMFVSVTERTREIGIRKAIGAKPHSILCQFLFEAAAICLMGGVIGIVLAAGVTAVIDAVLMPASLSVPILAIAVTVAVAVGVLAGLVPAIRGARLHPVEALRYE
jgi:putative ABC transport system permease protein